MVQWNPRIARYKKIGRVTEKDWTYFWYDRARWNACNRFRVGRETKVVPVVCQDCPVPIRSGGVSKTPCFPLERNYKENKKIRKMRWTETTTRPKRRHASDAMGPRRLPGGHVEQSSPITTPTHFWEGPSSSGQNTTSILMYIAGRRSCILHVLLIRGERPTPGSLDEEGKYANTDSRKPKNMTRLLAQRRPGSRER